MPRPASQSPTQLDPADQPEPYPTSSQPEPDSTRPSWPESNLPTLPRPPSQSPTPPAPAGQSEPYPT
ncbi:PREDICTED: extensin-like [Pygoscelis adeliae]|uniref:extensin-like n=1 Tax=Pygoscelis adeliae TaxID=9238 RepID=UPI0004F4E4AD|nr:PREDICTED: extensin-like [Pygoscelis adeliae]